MNGRLRHIDIARGIAILMVVFGHSEIVTHSFITQGKLFKVIFSFHLPLFFFLSGLFFKPKLGLKVLVVQRGGVLLKPYFVVFSLLLVVITIVNAIGHRIGTIPQGILGYFLAVIYGIGNTLPIEWSPLWFLPHLWAVNIFTYAFLKAVGYDKRTALIKSIFLLVLLLTGYFTISLFRRLDLHGGGISLNGLPFSIDILCLTAFYFLCGFTMREKINNINNNGLLLFIATAAFSLLHYFFNYTIQFDHRIYDDLLVCTAEALCGIYITLAASRIIFRNDVLSRALAYIGSGSIFILIFHLIIQHSLELYFSKVVGRYVASFVAILVSVCVPLLLGEIVKRNYYLSILLLPLKLNKTLQRSREEDASQRLSGPYL